MWTDEQIKLLEIEAEKHDGKCSNCKAIIRIYRYPVNKQIATILRAMRAVVDLNGKNEVNFDQMNLPYRLGTQRTKLRLHGLIRQVENDGAPVKNTWLITKKGGDFLRGDAIPKTVVVFRNQVIGHDSGVVTIKQVMNEASFQQDPISEPEARAYDNVREPRHETKVRAIYKGLLRGIFVRGEEYELVIGQLVVGKPVTMLKPREQVYPDIAAFQRDWKVT